MWVIKFKWSIINFGVGVGDVLFEVQRLEGGQVDGFFRVLLVQFVVYLRIEMFVQRKMVRGPVVNLLELPPYRLISFCVIHFHSLLEQSPRVFQLLKLVLSYDSEQLELYRI